MSEVESTDSDWNREPNGPPGHEPGVGADDTQVLYDTLESIAGTLESVLDRLDVLEQGAQAEDRDDAGDPTAQPAADVPLPAVDEPPAEELTQWVKWLVGRYGLAERFPDTWAGIPGVVDEMNALRMAWLYTYGEGPVPGFEATQWHDALARVLQRVVGSTFGSGGWTPDYRAARGRPQAR